MILTDYDAVKAATIAPVDGVPNIFLLYQTVWRSVADPPSDWVDPDFLNKYGIKKFMLAQEKNRLAQNHDNYLG